MNNDINNTLQALVPILQMNGENVQSIEAVQNWYNINGTEYMREVAEITYTNGYRKYADIGCDANLTAVYDVMAVLQEIKPSSKCIGRIVRGFYDFPPVEPELKELSEWKANFKGYINDLNIPKDDYDGILEYIDEVPPGRPDTNCSEIPNNSDTISRQQAIDALCSVCNALGGGHNCDKTKFVYNAPFDEQVILCPEHYALTMLPTIQPEQRWIPCSERLPEEPYGCLATVWDTNPVTMDEFENILPYFVGWDGEQWNDGDGEQCPFEVIAWKPLPEPYQEGGEHK